MGGGSPAETTQTSAADQATNEQFSDPPVKSSGTIQTNSKKLGLLKQINIQG